MNNSSRVLIDRKSFEEYHENERKKTLLIYKILLVLFLIANISFLCFIVTYKIQINSVQANNISTQGEILEQQEKNKQMNAEANKKIVNLFSNVSVNKNLILELFDKANEFTTILNWTGIDKYDLYLCYKATYDGDDLNLLRHYCDGDRLIIIIKADNGKRFGGYVSGIKLREKKTNKYKNDSAFLFSLDNLKQYHVSNSANAFIVDDSMSYISFGNDLEIYNGFFSKDCVARFPNDYGSMGNTLEDLNGGATYFRIEEIEILTTSY